MNNTSNYFPDHLRINCQKDISSSKCQQISQDINSIHGPFSENPTWNQVLLLVAMSLCSVFFDT